MNGIDYNSTTLLSPYRTMEIVLESIKEIVSYELGVILSLEEGNILKVRHGQGPLYSSKIKDYTVSLYDRPQFTEILESGEVKLFDTEECQRPDNRDTYDDIISMPHNHTCLVAPLSIEGKAIGLLTLDHRQCKAFTQNIIHIIKVLSKIVALALAQSVVVNALHTERDALVCERNALLENLSYTLSNMVGNSQAWINVLEKIRLVASTHAPVMILGETGTGKEQVARSIHTLSPRSHRPFVALNCSSLTGNLVESELFGHERGAFTGAISRRRGRFELAHNGTLFLDEIADLPMVTQPKLLRSLQDGTFERLGGESSIQSDVRIVCATNADLEKAAQEGSFRKDLFYRLNVFPIHLPPLRDRGDDVILLANHFLSKLAPKFHKKNFVLSHGAQMFLKDYSWPGNVRELQNTMERAAILSQGTIEIEHLEKYTIPQSPSKSPDTPYPLETLDTAISQHIKKALQICKGKIYGAEGAASLLAIKPTTLQSKMNKLGIRKI